MKNVACVPRMKKVGIKEAGDNLECRNCPYGKEDFDRRMAWYSKIIKERGIPNDIYHYLKPQDALNEFEQFIWCDKVGGKVYCFGHCSDAYSNISKYEKHTKKRKKNTFRR